MSERRTSSVRFDVPCARAAAKKKGWTLRQWAKEADLSINTLQLFITGDIHLKLLTVEQILRPLGLRAIDLVIDEKDYHDENDDEEVQV